MSINDPLKRLQIIQTPVLRGWTVEQTATFYGISTATLYVWRRRYAEEGIQGLSPRSRRPTTSPNQVTGPLEDRIVAMRRRHSDWGARRIHDELHQSGLTQIPVVSTIHRVLVRNGLVQPRPTGSRQPPKRFERPQPNNLWQLDATEWELADASIVYVFDLLDDHSRVVPAAIAWRDESGDNAWDTLQAGIDLCGAPRQLLTDNATYFTGRQLKAVTEFERRCWRAAIDTIHCAPYHPQTLGKIERQHRTLKQFLRAQPRATTIPELQDQLDHYRDYYNHERPHQELDGATPWQRFTASPPAIANTPPPTHEFTRPVASNGTVQYAGWAIHIGRRWARQIVTVIEHADKLRITHADELIATVALDPDQHPNHYISTGRPKGRPKQQPPT